MDSTRLGRGVAFSLYLPPCYGAEPRRAYPVIYLLHGANADETQWPDLNIRQNADAMIGGGASLFIVVMPGGEYRPEEDYAAFIVEDLIPHVEARVTAASDRRHRVIGGLSQGGYIALQLALSHPELFSAVGAHSPSTAPALASLLGDNPNPQQLSLRIYMDVGDADPLRLGVEALASTLQQHGLSPKFHVYPGGHDRPYWRSHTAEYLAFYTAGW